MEYKLKINDEIKTIETTAEGDDTIKASMEGGEVDVTYTLVSDHQIHFDIDGVNVNAFVMDGPDGKTVLINGVAYLVEDVQTTRAKKKGSGSQTPTEVTPITPSVVISVPVDVGDRVKKGQGVVVLSAMKMETTLAAPFDGTVTGVNVAEGESVSPGQILVDIEADEVESSAGEDKNSKHEYLNNIK